MWRRIGNQNKLSATKVVRAMDSVPEVLDKIAMAQGFNDSSDSSAVRENETVHKELKDAAQNVGTRLRVCAKRYYCRRPFRYFFLFLRSNQHQRR